MYVRPVCDIIDWKREYFNELANVGYPGFEEGIKQDGLFLFEEWEDLTIVSVHEVGKEILDINVWSYLIIQMDILIHPLYSLIILRSKYSYL